MRRLGVDIGGVIIKRHFEPGDVGFFEGNYLDVPAVEGAFEALSLLTQAFGGEIFLVSACTEVVEANTLDWFRHHDFCAKTGVKNENMRFCRMRRLKAPICSELGITDFVDDRMKVLELLTTVSRRHLYCPGWPQVHSSRYPLETECPGGIRVSRTWAEVQSAIMSF